MRTLPDERPDDFYPSRHISDRPLDPDEVSFPASICESGTHFKPVPPAHRLFFADGFHLDLCASCYRREVRHAA